MSKLVFPTVSSRAYASALANFRNNFRFIARTLERSPGMLVDLRKQLAVLGVITGASPANASVALARNSVGSKTSAATFVVANGAISSVDLAATSAIVTTGQALTGVTPTGVFTTTVGFTVAGGVITGIALS